MTHNMIRRFLLVGLTTMALHAIAEENIGHADLRIERLLAQSDLVARVQVLATDHIRKPLEEVHGELVVDLYTYGRLLTLQVHEIYTYRGQHPPEILFVFQGGAVRGLGQVPLRDGREYIAFLKVSPPPDLVREGVKTQPLLPEKPYYVVVEERKGAFGQGDTDSLRIKAFFRERKDDALEKSSDE